MDGELEAQARAWAAEDPDPETRAEVEALLARGDEAGLRAAFGHPLTFGTAGLRGEVGAGPARMNRLVARRTTAGVAAWVGGGGSVVVGCDARRGSASFADEAAATLAGAGVRPIRLSGVVPTPVLAFAVPWFGASAGVMVTASHNPPADNGYKLYGSRGGQVLPEVDRVVLARAAESRGSGTAPFEAVDAEDVVQAYVARAVALRTGAGVSRVRIAYTPLHGVGRDVFLRVLRAAGHDDVHVVPSQGEPDARFPTVAFPNPEEPGALELVEAHAREVGAALVLANDPDADRIAVSVPVDGRFPLTPSLSPDGGGEGVTKTFRRLTGNEIGVLLADDLLTRGEPGPRFVGTTLVSSRLLGAIAAHHGAELAVTPTGFKYLGAAAEEARSRGVRFVLGYEEALGVAVGPDARDKDGLTAALLVADLASRLADDGQTLLDALDRLELRHGVHLSGAITVTGSPEALAARMASVRAAPWSSLGGRPVDAVRDHLSDASPVNLVALSLGRDRVQLRPSGTEPKLKVYLEVIEPVASELAAARVVARQRLGSLAEAVRQAMAS